MIFLLPVFKRSHKLFSKRNFWEMVGTFRGSSDKVVLNPPFTVPSTKDLESQKAPKGWRDDYATAQLAMDGPFERPGLQDFRAQESSGNWAPFSLVSFFWANKRSELQLPKMKKGHRLEPATSF